MPLWVLVATLVLLSELAPITHLADMARSGGLANDAMRTERTSLVVHSGGGILTLLVPMVLSIYKPRGLTKHGRRVAAAADELVPRA